MALIGIFIAIAMLIFTAIQLKKEIIWLWSKNYGKVILVLLIFLLVFLTVYYNVANDQATTDNVKTGTDSTKSSEKRVTTKVDEATDHNNSLLNEQQRSINKHTDSVVKKELEKLKQKSAIKKFPLINLAVGAGLNPLLIIEMIQLS